MLVDLCSDKKPDSAIAKVLNNDICCGAFQNKRKGIQSVKRKFQRGCQISAVCHTQRQAKASFIIACEINNPAFKHCRIGYANVVSVKAQQNSGAAGQANDFARIATDFDCIIWPEWLANRQHD